MKTRSIMLVILTTLFTLASMSYGADATKTKSTSETQSLDAMNKQMANMQKEMAVIRDTKDPKKKQKLLEDHMKSMQNQTDMMGQMIKDMGMMEGGAMGQGKMGNNQHQMMGQMGQMHGMMGQTIGQMQEHMTACPFSEATKK